VQAGLVFNPATPLNWLDYVIEKIDLILVMWSSRLRRTEVSSRGSAKLGPKRARGSRLPSAKFASKSTAGQSRECRRDSQGRRGHVCLRLRIFGSADYASTIKSMRAQIEIGSKSA